MNGARLRSCLRGHDLVSYDIEGRSPLPKDKEDKKNEEAFSVYGVNFGKRRGCFFPKSGDFQFTGDAWFDIITPILRNAGNVPQRGG